MKITDKLKPVELAALPLKEQYLAAYFGKEGAKAHAAAYTVENAIIEMGFKANAPPALRATATAKLVALVTQAVAKQDGTALRQLAAVIEPWKYTKPVDLLGMQLLSEKVHQAAGRPPRTAAAIAADGHALQDGATPGEERACRGAGGRPPGRTQ